MFWLLPGSLTQEIVSLVPKLDFPLVCTCILSPFLSTFKDTWQGNMLLSHLPRADIVIPLLKSPHHCGWELDLQWQEQLESFQVFRWVWSVTSAKLSLLVAEAPIELSGSLSMDGWILGCSFYKNVGHVYLLAGNISLWVSYLCFEGYVWPRFI